MNELIREVVRVARDPLLVVWCLFVFLMPVYVFSSGLPQPGDLLLLALLPLSLSAWDGRLHREISAPLRALLWFTAWVIVVDFVWALVVGDLGLFGKDTFLQFPLYYVYNAVVFLIAGILYRRHGVRFLWLTLHIVFFAAVTQVGVTFVLGRMHGFRHTGFFNNPNQLGFYALLSGTIIALGKRRLGFGMIKATVGMSACLYLALVSASKAAVIGIGVLFILTIVSNPRLIFAAALAVVGLVSIGGPVADAIDATERRLEENRYPQYNFFEQRGYDRIYQHEEYWLFGAGEGGTSRFADTTVIGDHEVHSSVGTVFFCYGIVGCVFFAGFLFSVIRGAGLRMSLILVPPLLYTIAHQGLRVTLLWLLFGMFCALKHLERAPAPRRP